MNPENPDLKLDLDGNPLPWFQQPKPQKYLLGGALVIALVVVFGLPKWVPDVAKDVDVSGTQSAPSVERSPFQDAQEAKARREAQGILAKIVEIQSKLEAQKANLWAQASYQAILSRGELADQHYRDREFLTALNEYQEILKGLDLLNSQSVDAHKNHLTQGKKALLAGNSQQSQALYSIAQAIESHPDSGITSAEGASGLAQAENLDKVLKILRQSELYSQTNHHQKALDTVQSALALDPKSPQALNKQQQLQSLIRNNNYQSAMSRGYQALENQQYKKAKQAFSQALSIDPNSSAAKIALKQTGSSADRSYIGQLEAKALALEEQELWHQALNQYQTLQNFDASLMSARIGLLRTQARANLSDRLNQAISAPLNLKDSQNRLRAEQALKEAQALKPRGKQLDQQIQQLSTLLERSTQAIAIQLKSDNQTQITLLRQGMLGRFIDRELELTPGRYTLVGTRDGYRDVRRVFTVDFTQSNNNQAITIICNEEV